MGLVGLAIIGFVMVTGSLVGRGTDRRHIQVLARHVGCSDGTATRLYRLARAYGYGAAYCQVFPDGAITGTLPD